MKEGWEYKTLGEISGIVNNINWKNDGDSYLYIDLTSVDRETSNISNTIQINRLNAPSRAKQIVKKGDILFATTRPTLRRVAIIDEEYDNNICSTGFCVLRPIADSVIPKLVFYILKSDQFYKYIEPLQTGANYPAVTNSAVKLFNCLIPEDISTQRSIVSYLDTTFANIDNLKSNASKALSEAKALFQAALAEAMMPKEGWEEKTLGEIAEIKGGKRVPKGYSLSTIPTKHKYIRVADFNDNGTVDIKSVLYISDDVYNQIKRYTISSKDVYVSIAGTIGKTGIIPKELDGANLTENACKLSLKTDVDKFFLYYFTKSKLFIDQINELTRKSAQPKLALTRLAKVVIPYPSISQQHQIVRHLDSLSSKVRQMEENYRKTLAECDALKQAILRDVFE